MRTRAKALVGALLLATFAACSPSEPPTPTSTPTPLPNGLRPLTIREPAEHWAREGWIELVPAVRLPTTRDGDDRIRVFAKLPEHGRIRAQWLPDQERHTVRLPAGAAVDRVESWSYRTPAGEERETVVDVRGLRMSDDGPRHHVLRPVSGAPQAPLVGWSWPAADDVAHAEATVRLGQFLRNRPAPVNQPSLTEHEIADVVAANDCGGCHAADRPADPLRTHLPRRPTDGDGSFAVLMVLERETPVSTARPQDLNHRDPFVTLHCEDGVQLASVSPMPRCRDGATPIAVRNVAAGLAAGDDYTVRVCESRRRLWEHMDGPAREAFADAFRECGLVIETPTLASAVRK